MFEKAPCEKYLISSLICYVESTRTFPCKYLSSCWAALGLVLALVPGFARRHHQHDVISTKVPNRVLLAGSRKHSVYKKICSRMFAASVSPTIVRTCSAYWLIRLAVLTGTRGKYVIRPRDSASRQKRHKGPFFKFYYVVRSNILRFCSGYII